RAGASKHLSRAPGRPRLSVGCTNRHCRLLDGARLVAEVRAQPALDLRERFALPRRVILDLIPADPADREVASLGVAEVDAADARAGDHREGLRERDADVLRLEQLEELPLLAVVRARGVPERRPDAAVALGDQLFVRELAPVLVPLAPCDLVQVLGERLGQAVRERLRNDRAVVVVLGLEAGRELLEAETGGDRERADVVTVRSDVVGEAAVRPRVAVGGLLSQEAEA